MSHPPLWSLVLFSRIDVAGALAHPTRQAIVETLREEPGATAARLAQRFGVDGKTILHHLRVLARHQRVRMVPDGRARRCYLPGAVVRPPLPPRWALALAAIEAGAAGPADVARALAVPRGTAGSVLASLERNGLLVREGAGWRLSGRAREALAARGPPAA